MGTNPLKVVSLNCADCGKAHPGRNCVSDDVELSERGIAEDDRGLARRLQADLVRWGSQLQVADDPPEH
jgi:hypothetical protein